MSITLYCPRNSGTVVTETKKPEGFPLIVVSDIPKDAIADAGTYSQYTASGTGHHGLVIDSSAFRLITF